MKNRGIEPPLAGCTEDQGFQWVIDIYGQMEQQAPRAILVHAKTYFGGGRWYTLDLDYRCIANLLRKNRYQGYITLEYEGRDDPTQAVPRSITMLRKTFA